MTAWTMITKTARKSSVTSKAALGRYLAAGLGATGLASVESEAGIVNLDITNIGSNNQNVSGVNAGVVNEGQPYLKNVFGVVNGRGFTVANYDFIDSYGVRYSKVGLNTLVPQTTIGLNFLTGATSASPFRFTEAGTSSVGPINPAGTFWSAGPSAGARPLFQNSPSFRQAPDWGPGSFIGFRALVPDSNPAEYNYGYFEVTWSASTSQFQILSGAYESTPNTPIAVPEPSTVALAGIGALALGAGAIRRSRKARKAAAEGTLAEAV